MLSIALQSTEQTNRVLRNTFLLLALTLIPTIFGGFTAAAIGIPALMASSPLLSFLGFLAIAAVLLFGIHANSDNYVGIGLLGLFTFVMGGVLSGGVTAALSLPNGAGVVAMAIIGTISVMIGCSLYAMTTKRDFSGLGGFLFGAVIALVVVSLANIYFQLSLLHLAISVVALLVFSIYLVYDVQQVVSGRETNYVIATVSIYLDLVNIFSSLLNIFGYLGGGDVD